MDTTSTIKTVIGAVLFVASTIVASAAVSPRGPIHTVADGIVALSVPTPSAPVVLDTITIEGTVQKVAPAKKPAAKKVWTCGGQERLLMGPVGSRVVRCDWRLYNLWK